MLIISLLIVVGCQASVLAGASPVSIWQNGAADGTRNQTQGWLVGLNWQDAFMKGNRLGFAAGQPQFVTGNKGQGKDGQKYADDGNYAFELYYDFQVTDNITVTPALFYLSRPFGEKTGTSA